MLAWAAWQRLVHCGTPRSAAKDGLRLESHKIQRLLKTHAAVHSPLRCPSGAGAWPGSLWAHGGGARRPLGAMAMAPDGARRPPGATVLAPDGARRPPGAMVPAPDGAERPPGATALAPASGRRTDVVHGAGRHHV